MKFFSWLVVGLSLGYAAGAELVLAAPTRSVDEEISCEVLVVGGGLAGVATAYEALKAGHSVCLTEITDWLGGQISAQGTSALDESASQSALLYYPQGYLEMRQQLIQRTGRKRAADCWVSLVCFLPHDGHEIVLGMLKDAAKQGKGRLRLFPNTVVKELQLRATDSGQIQSVRAVQHTPAPGAPPLNTYPLSQTIQDSYSEQDSALFQKKILRFVGPSSSQWYVVEATETGEVLALADLPYRLGIDHLSYEDPSASSPENYAYCPQAYTYTFAMQATAKPQTYEMPAFYPQYDAFYSYAKPQYAKVPAKIFTYRRIWSVNPQAGDETVNPGDISMQNWETGNDYGPGTSLDNYLYTREQLALQLTPSNWQGGGELKVCAGLSSWPKAIFTGSSLARQTLN